MGDMLGLKRNMNPNSGESNGKLMEMEAGVVYYSDYRDSSFPFDSS